MIANSVLEGFYQQYKKGEISLNQTRLMQQSPPTFAGGTEFSERRDPQQTNFVFQRARALR